MNATEPRPGTAEPGEVLSRLCHEALHAINRAADAPPTGLKRPIDEAERAAVRFRDELIDRLRGDHSKTQERQWRTVLDRVNSAISVLNALEYPAAGVQRELLQQVRKVFRGLARRHYA